MKNSWIAMLALGFALPATAQVMSVAPFRDNDPFVFCTQGYELTVAQECWTPLPPYTTGDYMLTGICDPPNYYGRSWTDRDWTALYLYETVCPIAVVPGAWMGVGTGAQAPVEH